MDRYFAEDRTAVVFRGGVRTVKKMFETGNPSGDAAECATWVAARNAEINPPKEEKKREPARARSRKVR